MVTYRTIHDARDVSVLWGLPRVRDTTQRTSTMYPDEIIRPSVVPVRAIGPRDRLTTARISRVRSPALRLDLAARREIRRDETTVAGATGVILIMRRARLLDDNNKSCALSRLGAAIATPRRSERDRGECHV